MNVQSIMCEKMFHVRFYNFKRKLIRKPYPKQFLMPIAKILCFYFAAPYIIGRPIPRPIGGICGSPPDGGLLIVSSTDSIMQAASHAACKAFILMIDGSHTQDSKLSATVSLLMSTPYQQLPVE